MRKQDKIGYGLVVVSVLLMLVGTVGFTLKGEVNDVPTPIVPNRTFFADEPLPEHTLGMLVTATLTLTWDRDDIYVVIAGEDEKKACESVPPGLLNEGSTSSCKPFDNDVIVGGNDGEVGLEWKVEDGVYFAGLGTTSTAEGLPEGTEVNLDYSVDLQAGFVTYFIFALIGIGGLAYTRVE